MKWFGLVSCTELFCSYKWTILFYFALCASTEFFCLFIKVHLYHLVLIWCQMSMLIPNFVNKRFGKYGQQNHQCWSFNFKQFGLLVTSKDLHTSSSQLQLNSWDWETWRNYYSVWPTLMNFYLDVYFGSCVIVIVCIGPVDHYHYPDLVGKMVI